MFNILFDAYVFLGDRLNKLFIILHMKLLAGTFRSVELQFVLLWYTNILLY